MKHKLITLLLTTTMATACKSPSVLLTSKMLPSKTYHTRSVTISYNEIDILADEETINKMTEAGVQLPIIMSSEGETTTDIFTGELDTNGYIDTRIHISKATSTTTALGETKTEDKPLAGVTILGSYNPDFKLEIDTIMGGQLSPELKELIKSMMQEVQQQVEFPEKPLKIGEHFENQIPMTLPISDAEPINLLINIRYTLTKVKRGLAFFDLVQDLIFDMDEPAFEMDASGTGSGNMIYHIKDQYMISYISEIPMKVKAKTANLLTLDMTMNIKTDYSMEIR